MTEPTYQPNVSARDNVEQRPRQQPVPAVQVVKPLSTAGLVGVENAKAAKLPHHVARELEDAETLIDYAAGAGIDIEEDVRQSVLRARIAVASGWTEEHSLQLLNALTRLSARIKPVTAESLQKCIIKKEAARTILKLSLLAAVLAAIIVPFSVVAFVASATCEGIHNNIELANSLAVTLVRESSSAPAAQPTDPPTGAEDLNRYSEDQIRRLQQFAATIRAIDSAATQLEHLSFLKTVDPLHDARANLVGFKKQLELPVRLSHVGDAIREKVILYQDVRFFAQSVQQGVLNSFGAATIYILPLLYALLGACAFLVRSFEEQRKARTYTGAEKLAGRFLIAGIGGLVVGLFGNFGEGHGVSLQPLAIAFLVGYAVDVFFVFLDGLLQTVGRSRAEAATETAPPSERSASAQSR